MDFFGAQEQAKQRTGIAIILFVLAVVLTALGVYAAYTMAMHYDSPLWYRAPIDSFDLATFLWCVGGTVAVILGGTFFKVAELSGGGLSVAQSVGARAIDRNTQDEQERILLNVVEEMSLASGYSVPQVGVLDDEPEINAFAAAISPRDAVVVVTRGTLNYLNREELQAVIGHEFSHLLNGDCKLNIQLAGWIWGLFLVSIMGRFALNSASGGGSSDRRRGAVAFMIFGFALLVIGSVGFFFGRVIQALISRQREFLADASSVQFTRNPQAMVMALAKIQAGSQIEHHHAAGLAHFFFATSGMNGIDLMATHPPLEKRMAAIDPNYGQLVANIQLPIIEKEPAAPEDAV
jgi:Zn-dependent protease with chaperone function